VAAGDRAHAGHRLKAMFNLGYLEDGQGQIDQARRWWRAVADSSHPDQAPKAMLNLGKLEDGQGQIDLARRWWRAAIDTSHPDLAPKAMLNLGLLEVVAGLEVLARQWFERAISIQHADAGPLAMICLAKLVEDRNPDQARQLYRGTLHTKHGPLAMVCLGRLEARIGQITHGKSWLQAAIDTGHPEASREARRELERIATSEDEQRAQSWAQYGHPSRQQSDGD
jgi:tetratricopeptide (TPR) repeat protein